MFLIRIVKWHRVKGSHTKPVTRLRAREDENLVLRNIGPQGLEEPLHLTGMQEMETAGCRRSAEISNRIIGAGPSEDTTREGRVEKGCIPGRDEGRAQSGPCSERRGRSRAESRAQSQTVGAPGSKTTASLFPQDGGLRGPGSALPADTPQRSGKCSFCVLCPRRPAGKEGGRGQAWTGSDRLQWTGHQSPWLPPTSLQRLFRGPPHLSRQGVM